MTAACARQPVDPKQPRPDKTSQQKDLLTKQLLTTDRTQLKDEQK